MNATIIYDNTSKKGFQSGWGFSCLVDQKIMFDTGEAPEPLFYNMQRLKVNISNIEAVVISHNHWDHTGGLWELLKKRKGLKVYGCPRFSDEFKKQVTALEGTLIESGSFQEIDAQISVTGEIAGQYKGEYMPEQALIVKTEKGMTVITGCSHPGIVTMIEKVKERFPQQPISTVLGGFHLMDKDTQAVELIVEAMKDMKVENIGPTHCTGKKAQIVFKKSYGKHFLSIMAGQTVEV